MIRITPIIVVIVPELKLVSLLELELEIEKPPSLLFPKDENT
jgi:hypothetical protein